jgi:uncharacterized membrane protein
MTDARYRMISIVLSLIGALDSAYLTWVKITHQEAFCGGSGECATVANSPYSEIFGIPIAILGLGAYLVIIGLHILESRSKLWLQNAPLLIFGMTLAGTIYSAYLTYLEIWVIYAICPYCVLSAVVMTLLMIIALIRFWRGQSEFNPIGT